MPANFARTRWPIEKVDAIVVSFDVTTDAVLPVVVALLSVLFFVVMVVAVLVSPSFAVSVVAVASVWTIFPVYSSI